MKLYEVYLPYFKQGDDLSECLKESRGNTVVAFKEHSERMMTSAYILDQLSKYAEKNQIKIKEADTHCILVSVNPEIVEELLEEHLIHEPEWLEEDEEDEGNFGPITEVC